MIARLEARWDNPARRARLLWLLWLISSGFTIFGFGVILYRVLFRP